ncbi:hypothetical protein Syun_021908 [Stephania yunnanensis]|uniref:Uncharacterized protein n=1 Tax=Stephania yunnanensis TaxID=152371 RepID=A0AAP0IHX6_9MAGN
MEIKKRNKGSTTDEDHEIAVVKAAAWAWYQRGSRSDGKPIVREFDAAARLYSRRGQVMSRFKHEDMVSNMTKNCSSTSTHDQDYDQYLDKSPISFTLSPTNSDTSSSALLDRYEIQSISKRLECLIIDDRDNQASTNYYSTNSGGGDGGGAIYYDGMYNSGRLSAGDRGRLKGTAAASPREAGGRRKTRTRKNKGLMYLVSFRHGTMLCGSKGDHVVEPRVLGGLRPMVRGSVFGRTEVGPRAR